MKLLRWLPAFIWVAIICWLSFSSLEQVKVPQFFSADKVGHIVMYGVLGGFLYLPSKGNKNQYIVSMFLALVFAALTEFIQHFVVINRTGELGDFLANCIGLALSFLLLKRLQKT